MKVSPKHQSTGSKTWLLWGVDLNVSSLVVRTQGLPFSFGYQEAQLDQAPGPEVVYLGSFVSSLLFIFYVLKTLCFGEELLNTLPNEVGNKLN